MTRSALPSYLLGVMARHGEFIVLVWLPRGLFERPLWTSHSLSLHV